MALISTVGNGGSLSPGGKANSSQSSQESGSSVLPVNAGQFTSVLDELMALLFNQQSQGSQSQGQGEQKKITDSFGQDAFSNSNGKPSSKNLAKNRYSNDLSWLLSGVWGQGLSPQILQNELKTAEDNLGGGQTAGRTDPLSLVQEGTAGTQTLAQLWQLLSGEVGNGLTNDLANKLPNEGANSQEINILLAKLLGQQESSLSLQAGNNSGTSELVNSQRVIATLLQELSGKITTGTQSPSTTQGAQLGGSSLANAPLAQEIPSVDLNNLQTVLSQLLDAGQQKQESSGQPPVATLSMLLAKGTQPAGKDGANLANNTFEINTGKEIIQSILNNLQDSHSQAKDGETLFQGETKTNSALPSDTKANQADFTAIQSSLAALQSSGPNTGKVEQVNQNLNNNPIPPWEQLAKAFKDAGLNAGNSVKSLEIQLQPEDLGKISVLLHWDNGQVNLQVQASESATAKMLQSHAGDLRQSLESMGVACGRFDMGMGNGGQSGYRQEQAFSQYFVAPNRLPTELPEDRNVVYAQANTSPTVETGQHRINITA